LTEETDLLLRHECGEHFKNSNRGGAKRASDSKPSAREASSCRPGLAKRNPGCESADDRLVSRRYCRHRCLSDFPSTDITEAIIGAIARLGRPLIDGDLSPSPFFFRRRMNPPAIWRRAASSLRFGAMWRKFLKRSQPLAREERQYRHRTWAALPARRAATINASELDRQEAPRRGFRDCEWLVLQLLSPAPLPDIGPISKTFPPATVRRPRAGVRNRPAPNRSAGIFGRRQNCWQSAIACAPVIPPKVTVHRARQIGGQERRAGGPRAAVRAVDRVAISLKSRIVIRSGSRDSCLGSTGR